MMESKKQDKTKSPKVAVIGTSYWGKNLVRNYHIQYRTAFIRLKETVAAGEQSRV